MYITMRLSFCDINESLFLVRALNCVGGSFQQQQWYSMYPPSFQEPVYQQEKLDEMIESGEAAKKALVPVRAACNDQNSSIFQDPLTKYETLNSNSLFLLYLIILVLFFSSSKFVNMVMEKGKKLLARSLVESVRNNALFEYNFFTWFLCSLGIH